MNATLTTDDYHNRIKEIINTLDWRIVNRLEVTDAQIRDTINRVDILVYRMYYPAGGLQDIRHNNEEGWDGNFTKSNMNIKINDILENINWQIFARDAHEEIDNNNINMHIGNINNLIWKMVNGVTIQEEIEEEHIEYDIEQGIRRPFVIIDLTN
jgi:hypothetical protein